MASLGELSVDLIADNSGFKKSLDSAEKRTKSFGKSVKSSLSGIGKDIAKLGKGVGIVAGIGVAGVAAFTAIAKSAADAGQQINTASKAFNVGVVPLQKWAIAGKTVGFEMQDIGNVFKDVSDRIGDFLTSGGGPMQQFFTKIAPKVGVTAEQFKNLSGPQALEKFVSVGQAAGMSTQQLAHMMETLSGNSSRLLPLLVNNAEGFKKIAKQAEDLGLIISGPGVKALATMNTKMQLLGKVFTSFKNQAIAGLAPMILNILQATLKWIKAQGGVGEIVKKVLPPMLHGFAETVKVLKIIKDVGQLAWYTLKTGMLVIINVAARIFQALVAEVLNPFKLIAKAGAALGSDAAQSALDAMNKFQSGVAGVADDLQEQMDKAANKTAEAAKNLGHDLVTPAKSFDHLGESIGDTGKAFDLLASSVKSTTVAQNAGTTASKTATDQAKKEADARKAAADEALRQARAVAQYKAALGKQAAAAQGQLGVFKAGLGMGDFAAGQARKMAGLKNQRAQAITALQQRQQTSANPLSEKNYQAELDALKDYWDKRISIEQQKQQIERQQRHSYMAGTEKYIANFRERVNNNAAIAAQVMGGITDGFVNAFTAVITHAKSAGDAFRQFGLTVLKMLAKIIVEKTIAKAISSVMGYANGGVPTVGVPSLVGENGPELFVPSVSGHVVPTKGLGSQQAQNGESSASKSPTIINTIDSGSFLSEGLGSGAGEDAMFNFISANRQRVKGLLG